MHLWQIKKLHRVSVFKYAGSFPMTLSHRARDFWRAEHSPLVHADRIVEASIHQRAAVEAVRDQRVLRLTLGTGSGR